MSNASAASTRPHVAIVGSGPSGCYAAQMLRKTWPEAEITVFDRLPVPFGLLRYGVAPDHQHTKQLAHQFTRVFDDAGTRFAGNVEIGRDVSVEELRERFHVVVLAAGLATDRPLGVAGTARDGIYGAGQVMRWVNAHPDEGEFEPALGDRVVVVGTGNVAVDVVRMLAKGVDQFAGSDIHEPALTTLGTERPSRIHVVGRSSASQAKFDAAMIRELAEIPDVAFEIEGVSAEELTLVSPAREERAKLEALQALAALQRPSPRVTVSLHFGWRPAAVLGTHRVDGVAFSGGSDGSAHLVLPADSVVTAIGFTADAEGPLAEFTAGVGAPGADRIRLRRGLYACGWFRRGATGSIPANRSCAKEVVGRIVEEIQPTLLEPRPGYDGLSEEVLSRAVDFAGWRQVDAFETAAAGPHRVRRKIGDREGLLAAARGSVADLTTYTPSAFTG